MKYELIARSNIHEFNNEVNDRIKEGWELYGNTIIDHNGVAYQPMIMKSKTQYNKKKLPYKISDICVVWNDVFKGTYVRQKRILDETTRKRLLAISVKEFHTLQEWTDYFTLLTKSDFLMGKTGDGKRRPFQLSLEWAIKPANMVKILEGAYHGEV